MMRHGILPALGAAALIAPVLRAQATPPPAPTRDAQEQQRKALEEKALRYLAAMDGTVDREASRRRILERVDKRIAEAMERLRTEIHAIVEEELARTASGMDREETHDRSEVAEGMEGFAPTTPWMGVELAGKEGAESLNVKRVFPVSPAAEAGMREGDHILSVLGVPVIDRAQLAAVLGTRMPGDRVEVKVMRDGEEVVLFVVLGVRPEGQGGMDEDDEEARLAAERADSAGARSG